MIKSNLNQSTAYNISSMLRERLEEIYNKRISRLFEDDNGSSLSEIMVTAKVLGGFDVEEQEGVVLAHFGTPKALRDFVDYLEENDAVDYYEIRAERKDGEKDSNEEIDFESLPDDDETYDFRIFVYSTPEDENLDDLEDISYGGDEFEEYVKNEDDNDEYDDEGDEFEEYVKNDDEDEDEEEDDDEDDEEE